MHTKVAFLLTQVLYDVFPKHIAQALVAGRKVEPENKEVMMMMKTMMIIHAEYLPCHCICFCRESTLTAWTWVRGRL